MAKIGIFRPSTGQWFLDSNGNGIFDSCTIDTCVTGYGSNAMLPVVADWEGTGHTSIGVFEPNTGTWHLDNGNGKWDACSSTGDTCVTTYGAAGSFPVVKELSSEKLVVGTFQPQVTTRVRGRKLHIEAFGILTSMAMATWIHAASINVLRILARPETYQ